MAYNYNPYATQNKPQPPNSPFGQGNVQPRPPPNNTFGAYVKPQPPSQSQLPPNSKFFNQQVSTQPPAGLGGTNVKRSPSQQSLLTTKNMVVCAVSLVFTLVLIIGISVILSAEEEQGFRLFPAETRSGNNYVAIFFEVRPSQAAGEAFTQAANKWSRILRGNENLLDGRQLQGACGRNFPEPLARDHLRIFSRVEPIDGVNNVLGSAGPCSSLVGGIPAFGQMVFDEADIDALEERGQLESVILHEMAHVLGIGTLWQIFQFIQNPLPDSVANPELPSPTYVGPLGSNAFGQIGGVGALGIEDGFTNGIFNQAGPGSVNGHFDEDSLGVELMTFRIKVEVPPLSIVSIRALEDFGYVVDIRQADAFSANSLQVVSGEDSLDENDYLVLYNDILPWDGEEDA